MPAAHSIFISYRRSDSAYVTGHIYKRLRSHFGKGVIFLDVQSIPLGVDFRKSIEQAVGNSQVLIAVIGDRWLEALHQRAAVNELDRDWVREEIETALALNDMPVIPLLIEQAKMPAAETLPQGMQDLVYRNGAQVRAALDFDHDVEHLIQSLERIIGVSSVSEKNPGSITLQVPVELSEDEEIQLVEALISAFPNKEALSLMVKKSLKRNLNLITQEASLYETTVTRLVDWAKAQGELQALIEGAFQRNSGNPKLKALVKIWSQ